MYHLLRNKDSSVGIATGYVLEARGFDSRQGQHFLFSTASRPALGHTQPTIQLVPALKQPGYELDGRGFDSRQGQHFLFSIASRPALGHTQPAIQLVPAVKQPGYEADHSSPSSADVKNSGAISPLPHMSSWHSA
jgi:hypothetical protein